MNAIINASSAPSHIAASQRLNLNAAARQNLTSSFPVISFRGKVWRIKYRGEETPMKGSAGADHNGRPLPEMPLQYLDVVVVGLSPNISKTYYEKAYGEGDENAPDCYSTDGITPDASAPKKQNTHCKLCRQNQFGSRITNAGKRAKACQDYRRIVITPSGDIANEAWGGPMLMRVPTMSLANLDRYATRLERMGADMSQVVTRLSFDPAMPYPAIQFAEQGWIEQAADYQQAVDLAQSDQVRRMVEEAVVDPAAMQQSSRAASPLGQRPAHLAAPAMASPVPVSPEPFSAPAPKPAPDPAPTPTPPPPVTPPAPPPEPKPAPPVAAVAKPNGQTKAAKAPPVIQGAPADLNAAVDDLLSNC